MPEIFVAIKRTLWQICGNEICATNVQNFNKTKGLLNPCILWVRGQRASVRMFWILGFYRKGCGCCHGEGVLCGFMWVDGTIRWGSYRHPSALLSHCSSLWHLVFTVLASVENRESYRGSQCAQWSYGNRSQRRPREYQSRKMPSAAQQ